MDVSRSKRQFGLLTRPRVRAPPEGGVSAPQVYTATPSSGYVATLFLNLVESSPSAALLPLVVQATTVWCSAYGVDTNFWVEKNIGGRVCATLRTRL